MFASPPVFEEPEDPSARSFFSEIISSVSDVKFSHSGRYLLTRDYLTAKVWDLNMESKPLETYQVRQWPAVVFFFLFFMFDPNERGEGGLNWCQEMH